MNAVIRKGTAYTAEYSSADFPVLSADWSGVAALYTTYPGTPVFSKALTVVDNEKLKLDLTIAEVLALDTGVYSFLTTITNTVLGITINQLEYVNVTDITGFTATPMTRIYMSIVAPNGTALVGTPVTVTLEASRNIEGNVVGIKPVTITTNISGYAEVYIIKGLTVTISCPLIERKLTVKTADLDLIDISSFFK